MEKKFCTSQVTKNVGTFTWSLVGFSSVSDKVGDIVESPEFIICDRLWQLRIFPGGSLPQHAGQVSYYLASKASTVTKASYKLMILSQIPGEVDEVFASSGIRKFEAKGKQVDGWGRDKFISLEALKNPVNGLLREDTIIFRVEIHVVCGAQYISKPFVIDEFAKDILRMKELFPDVSLHLTGSVTPETITANKCILATRSPVFHAMLTNTMRETFQSVIELPDDPATFKELLHYIYTDACSHFHPDTDFVRDLLATAAKYQIKGLQSICESRLAIALTHKTAISTLIFADSLFAEELKRAALQYIARYYEELEKEEEFLLLDATFVQEIQDSKQSISRRYNIFSGGFKKPSRFCTVS